MMPYRVIVVDDSAFMRRIISDLIEQVPDFKVVGTAKNGREAVDLIGSEKPDLVTMDVEMPEMNGLEALGLIMQQHPLPVIMLSGINEQGMRETIMALELGAFDFIRKPSASTSSHDIEQVGLQLREQLQAAMNAVERRAARKATLESKSPERLPPLTPKPAIDGPDKKRAGTAKHLPHSVSKLKETAIPVKKPIAASGTKDDLEAKPSASPSKTQASGVKPSSASEKNTKAKPSSADRFSAPGSSPTARSRPAGKTSLAIDGAVERSEPPNEVSSEQRVRTSYTDLVAIGTSTGGPKALRAVLEKLPAGFPAPVIIVQHMPPNFTKSLAQRLNTLTELNVMEAEEGMILKAGEVYIAPGGHHMKVNAAGDGNLKITLSNEAPRNGHRPSVDVMYESLLPIRSVKRHIVLLTGMGSDGAKVMKQLYDTGVTSTIAESEETCVVYGMPRSAVELGCVSEVLPLHEIGSRLVQVVK